MDANYFIPNTTACKGDFLYTMGLEVCTVLGENLFITSLSIIPDQLKPRFQTPVGLAGVSSLLKTMDLLKPDPFKPWNLTSHLSRPHPAIYFIIICSHLQGPASREFVSWAMWSFLFKDSQSNKHELENFYKKRMLNNRKNILPFGYAGNHTEAINYLQPFRNNTSTTFTINKVKN